MPRRYLPAIRLLNRQLPPGSRSSTSPGSRVGLQPCPHPRPPPAHIATEAVTAHDGHAVTADNCDGHARPMGSHTSVTISFDSGATHRSQREPTAAKAALTPVRVVALSFAAAIVVGTILLLIPAATRPGSGTSVIEALFTATSAMCLTGLIVVDTPVHWSGFGQGVILALIQLGGLGIMTMASLVGLLLANRIGLKARLNTAAEARASGLGDVRSVVVGVVRVSLARSGHRGGVDGAVRARLRRAAAARPATGGLPRDLGVQQCSARTLRR